MDSVLIRIARGENGAFAECVDRYGSLVWGLARRMMRTPADAEDAVQDIFLKLWKSAAHFDAARGSEAVFIGMIARRALIDRMREKQRRPLEVSIDGVEPQVWHAESQSDVCMEAHLAADAMAKLRPEQQQVIFLSVMQGLSQAEIAEEMGMPLGTVKSLMRRGLLLVRDLLTEKARP